MEWMISVPNLEVVHGKIKCSCGADDTSSHEGTVIICTWCDANHKIDHNRVVMTATSGNADCSKTWLAGASYNDYWRNTRRVLTSNNFLTDKFLIRRLFWR